MEFASKPERVVPGPGQESAWDYPRPPRLELVSNQLVVLFAGQVVAETARGARVLETSHPPNYYFPPDDVRLDLLVPSGHRSFCEWKGRASYFDVVVGDRRARDAAWTYESPSDAFEPIRGWLAFYADRVDECRVDGEVVTPQPGGFYGGWITSAIVGPFKGIPGSRGW
jgi:uncharacterized protein (DUF427 family)